MTAAAAAGGRGDLSAAVSDEANAWCVRFKNGAVDDGGDDDDDDVDDDGEEGGEEGEAVPVVVRGRSSPFITFRFYFSHDHLLSKSQV